MSEYIFRPDCPKACGYQLYACENPLCGIHIISFDADNKPIVETILNPRQTRELAEACHATLYEKIATSDDKGENDVND